MKTQFIVTVTQTDENPATPRAVEGMLRVLARENLGRLIEGTFSATVRHYPGDQPEAPAPDLVQALRAAHKAGQRAGRMIGKDSDDAANAYAAEAAKGGE